MPWVRLADDFYDHPKIIAVGSAAGWLWVCGLAYANRYLTDGYLPSAAVRRIADDGDDPLRLAARLVEVGLWEAADAGYRIHDYTNYQPSAQAVKAERKKTAERVASWRKRSRDNDVSNGASNAVGTGAPGPDPDPVPGPGPGSGRSPARISPPSPLAGGGAASRRKHTNGRASETTMAAAAPSQASLTPEEMAEWAAR